MVANLLDRELIPLIREHTENACTTGCCKIDLSLLSAGISFGRNLGSITCRCSGKEPATGHERAPGENRALGEPEDNPRIR